MKTTLGALLVALLPTAPIAADVAGTWAVNAKIMEMEVPLTCTFKQDGEKLSGNCKGPGAPPDGVVITGETKGSKASWTYTVNVQGQDLTLTYAAEVDSPTTMKGDISMMGQPSGAFTAKKEEKKDEKKIELESL